jgi:hypothetical protein
MSQGVSDTELDNAKHEVEFCLGQIEELEPLAHQIDEGRSRNETLVDKLQNKIKTDQFDAQLSGLMIKTIGAQIKYIKLLERRIGR